MSKIDIRRKHGQSHKAAIAAVDKTVAAIARKFGVHSEWQGDTLHFERAGVNGKIRVNKHDVHVTAELGFLLGMMRPQIEAEIESQLDKNFG